MSDRDEAVDANVLGQKRAPFRHPSAETLARHCDGKGAVLGRMLIEQHLVDCDDCRRVATDAIDFAKQPRSRADDAAQAVHVAVADFLLALAQARTTEEALRMRQMIADVIGSLQAVEDAALRTADALCGASS